MIIAMITKCGYNLALPPMKAVCFILKSWSNHINLNLRTHLYIWVW